MPESGNTDRDGGESRRTLLAPSRPSSQAHLVHILDTDIDTLVSLSAVFRLEGFATAFSTNIKGFFESLEQQHPDAIIANLCLAGDSGLDVLRQLRTKKILTPIFMLSDQTTISMTSQALELDAYSVVSKPYAVNELVNEVRKILRMNVRHVQLRDRSSVPGYNLLTERERQILEFVVRGQSSKETGRRLGISPRTVEVHRSRCLLKLGARNAADLVRIVVGGF